MFHVLKFSKGQMKRLSPALGGGFLFDEKADLPLLRLGWLHELADGIEHNLVPKMNSVPVVPSFDRCAHIKPNSFNGSKVQKFNVIPRGTYTLRKDIIVKSRRRSVEIIQLVRRNSLLGTHSKPPE